MLLTVLAGLLLSADPIDACIASSDRAQQLRDERHWVRASKELLACSQEACPRPVRVNCQKWRAELELAMPSVLIQVQADGLDTPEAKASIDEVPVELEGTAVALDPGSHVFTATLGRRAVTLRVLVLEGEKNRKLVLALEPEPPLGATTSLLPVSLPAVARGRGLPVGSLILGGVGLAGFGVFAGLGLDGKSRLTALENDPCAASRRCDVTAVNAVKSQYVAADVTLAAASFALTFAITWALIWLATSD